MPRPRKFAGPPLEENGWGRRFVRVNRGGKAVRYPVESYCLLNFTRRNQVLYRMTEPEIRRALDREWSNEKRRPSVLISLTVALHARMRDAALEVIRRTVPRAVGGQHLKTVPQLEVAALKTWGPITIGPRKGQPRDERIARIHRDVLARKMRRRRAKFEQEAITKMRAAGRSKLTELERQELQRKAGDHFHDGMTAGELCGLCNEVIQDQGQMPW